MIRPVTTLAVLVLAASAPAAALAAPGDYDSAFSGDGIAARDLGGADVANDVAVSPGGLIVLAGASDVLPSPNFAVTRISANGQFLDASLPQMLVDFGGDDSAEAVAFAPDGGIVVAGASVTGGEGDVALARFDPEGGLDPDFGTDGKRTRDLGGDESVLDVAVDPAGRIVVAGATALDDDELDLILARFNSDGSIDTSFGEAGFVILDLPGVAAASSLAFDAQGRIVIAGGIGDAMAEDFDFLVARFSPNGVLDDDFAEGSGWRQLDLFVSAYAQAVTMAPDGRIVVAGPRFVDVGYSQLAAARLLGNGDLDPSFSDDGWNVADLGAQGSAEGVAVAPDGKVVVGGNRFQADPGVFDLVVARFGADGELDDGFGEVGVVWDTDPARDAAHAVAIDPQGRILLGGEFGSPTDFAAFRLEGDPVELDTTITVGPAEGETIAASSPEFSFSSSSPGVIAFECSADGAEFAACASPRKLAALSDGAHSFAVRAVNNIGTRDSSPATRSFSVDSSLAGSGPDEDPDPNRDPGDDADPGGDPDPDADPEISISLNRAAYKARAGKKLKLAYTISVPGKVKAVLKGAAKKTRRFKSLKKSRNHGEARTFRLSFALKSKPKQRRRARRRPLPKGPYKLKLKLTGADGSKATARAAVRVKASR